MPLYQIMKRFEEQVFDSFFYKNLSPVIYISIICITMIIIWKGEVNNNDWIVTITDAHIDRIPENNKI